MLSSDLALKMLIALVFPELTRYRESISESEEIRIRVDHRATILVPPRCHRICDPQDNVVPMSVINQNAGRSSVGRRTLPVLTHA